MVWTHLIVFGSMKKRKENFKIMEWKLLRETDEYYQAAIEGGLDKYLPLFIRQGGDRNNRNDLIVSPIATREFYGLDEVYKKYKTIGKRQVALDLVLSAIVKAGQYNYKVKRFEAEAFTKAPSFIIDGEVALGKSEVMMTALAKMPTNWRAVVFIENRKTIKKLVEELNEVIDKDKGIALAVVSEEGGSGTVDDKFELAMVDEDVRIIFATHAYYKNLLQEDQAQKIYDNFDVILVDEMFDTFATFVLDHTAIVGEILPTLYQYTINSSNSVITKVYNYFNSLFLQLYSGEGELRKKTQRENGGKYKVVLAEEVPELPKELLEAAIEELEGKAPLYVKKNEAHKNTIKYLKGLFDRGNSELGFFYYGSGGIKWVWTYNYFPKDVSVVFLFDGARRLPEMQALKEYAAHRINLEFLDIKIRDYSNWTFEIQPMPTGKSANSTNDEISKKKFLSAIKVLSKKHSSEKILVLMHKDHKRPFVLNPEDKTSEWETDHSQIPDNVELLSWGLHRSTNEYKDYTVVVVWSWYWQQEHNPAARMMSAFEGPDYEMGIYEDSDAAVNSTLVELKQGIGRIDRYFNSGRSITVYLTRPDTEHQIKEDTVKKYLREEFEGAKFNQTEWRDKSGIKLRENRRLAAIIGKATILLGDTDKGVILAKNVAMEAGLTPDQWKRIDKRGLLAEAFQELMSDKFEGGPQFSLELLTEETLQQLPVKQRRTLKIGSTWVIVKR